MKKILLLLSALVMTAAAALANTATFNFDGSYDLYGMTRYLGETAGTTEYGKLPYVPSLDMAQGSVNIKAVNTNTYNGSRGFALVKFNSNVNQQGLFIFDGGNSQRTYPNFTVSVADGNITKVTVVMTRSGLSNENSTTPKTIDFNGVATVAVSIDDANTGTYEWTGNAESMTFGWSSVIRAASFIHSIEVTYEPNLSSLIPPAASELKATISGDGSVEYYADNNVIIGTTKVWGDDATFTLTIPKDWDNFVYFDMSNALEGAAATQEDDDWRDLYPLDGFTLGNVITVPADGYVHSYIAMLVKGDKVYKGTSYNIQVSAAKNVVQTVSKTVTFDFVANDYGMQASYGQGKVMLEYEGLTLTNGNDLKDQTNGRKDDGLNIAVYPGSFYVSAVSGAVTEVTVTTVDNKQVIINYKDGVAQVQNYEDFGTTIITTMTVTYEDDGLQDAAISYPAATLQLISGVDNIKGLMLTNPNNVPVTYSSSNPDFLVNSKGMVSLADGVVAGTSVITAKFEGNSTYRPSEVSYTLTVIAGANSLAELKNIANQAGDKAYVNFPVVVAYSNVSSNKSLGFIQSLDGTENSLIFNSDFGTHYKPNDIIPAGWTATVTIAQEMLRYSMSEMPASMTTQEPKINEVSRLTTADYGQVAILTNVDLTEEIFAKMPDGKTGSYSVTVDGIEYEFNNLYKTAKPEAAGVYDVKCGVVLYDGKVRIYPLEFIEPLVYPTALDFTFNEEADVTVTQEVDFFDDLKVNIDGKVSSDNLIATIAIPKSWTNLLVSQSANVMVTEAAVSVQRRAHAAYWRPVSELLGDFALGNVLTLKPAEDPYKLYIYLVREKEADMANSIEVTVNVKKENTDGVEAIEAVDSDARYYTLDGIEVVTPEKGVYIKVVDGRVSKVVIR